VSELFEAAGERLLDEDPGVERGRMLHAPGLKATGRFFAFVRTDGELVVKVPAARVAALVASGEGLPFDRGQGTPMREWVLVRPADEAACDAILREARDFVGAG
jgi:hypothetical protein